MVSINKDHVVLQRTEDDEMDDFLTLPPLPNQEENHSATQEHPSHPKKTHDERKGKKYQNSSELEVVNNSIIPAAERQHEIANVEKEREIIEPQSLPSSHNQEQSLLSEDDFEPNTTVPDIPPTENDDEANEDVPFISEDPVRPFISEDPTRPFISEDPVRPFISEDHGRSVSLANHENRDKHHFKVACNTCDKKMLRASIVRHARNAHYLKGTWQELSRRVEEDQSNLSCDVSTTNTEVTIDREATTEADRAGEDTVSLNAQETSEEREVQIYLTSSKDKNEDSNVYHVLVPKEEHAAKTSLEAKMTELKNFEYYDVYEVVEKPKDTNIISTQWVLVDKEVPGQEQPVRKARLCMRGDQEKNVENISKDAPTVNKVNIKLMLMEAVRNGWDI